MGKSPKNIIHLKEEYYLGFSILVDKLNMFTCLPVYLCTYLRYKKGMAFRPSSLLQLLFLLRFHFLLMRFNDRARDVVRDRLVVIEFHCEVAAPASDGA